MAYMYLPTKYTSPDVYPNRKFRGFGVGVGNVIAVTVGWGDARHWPHKSPQEDVTLA